MEANAVGLPPLSVRLAGRLRVTAVTLGLLVAAVGAGHLIAWLSGYMTERGFSAITMKTNAVFALLTTGLALALLTRAPEARARRSVGRWLA